MISNFYLDVAEFESAIKSASDHQVQKNDTKKKKFLKRIEELYSGPLLESAYSDWIDPMRERYKMENINVLKSLVDICERQREYCDAIL